MSFVLRSLAVIVIGLLGWAVRRGRRPDLAMTGIVAVVSFLWLDAINGPAWVGHDQTTGLVMADDCLKLSQCHLTSVGSGVRGFTNGAMWQHLLTVIAYFGGTTVAVRFTLIAFMSLATAIVYLCTHRWLREDLALPASLFALFGMGGAGELLFGRDGVGPIAASDIIDASMLVLPATLVAAFLLLFVLSRNRLTLIAASVFASHAVNTHVGAASLVPALVASAALAGVPALNSALLAVAILGATSLVSSPYAIRDSLERLTTLEVLEALIAIAALAVAGSLLQSRFLRLGKSGRASVLAALLIVPLCSGVLWLTLNGREPSTRYLAPIIAPLALVLAAAATWASGFLARLNPRLAPMRRWAPLLIAAGCVIAARTPVDRTEWEFEDGRVLANALEHHGWCYGQDLGRLQASRCTTLTHAIMPYACHNPISKGDDNPLRQWRVWHAEAGRISDLPRSSEVLPSADGRVVVMSPIDSWLDKPAAEMCIGRPGVRKCKHADDPEAAPFLYSHRLALGFKDATIPTPFTMSFSFPVKAAAGESHLFSFGEDPLRLSLDAEGKPCGWKVTQVTGLQADRPLPANPVRLTSTDGKPGTLVIELAVGNNSCNGGFPGEEIPCHWETSADDPAWMSQLDERHQ